MYTEWTLFLMYYFSEVDFGYIIHSVYNLSLHWIKLLLNEPCGGGEAVKGGGGVAHVYKFHQFNKSSFHPPNKYIYFN